MKPIKNLYEQIYDWDNLYEAYLQARKCKRYRAEVLKFTSNLEENLITIQNELIYQSYEVGRYRQFIVSDPKKRMIMALPFKDRVVQWALYLVLNPIFTRTYMSDSFGCIQTKGTHSAIKRLQYWLRAAHRSPKQCYYLKLDVSKFYYRIDHAVMLEILGRKIADSKVLWLLEKIINCEDTAFGLPLGFNITDTDERLMDKGMPIGNLSSQMFANIYMNELDQYIKRTLQIRHYIRYMDDMIVLAESKQALHAYKAQIESYLNNHLKLHLNHKTCIRPASLGIEFVGYRIWWSHIKLRKSTALRMKRRLRKLQRQYAAGMLELEQVKEITSSFFGMLRHCNSYNLRAKTSETFVLKRSSNGCK